MEALAVQVDVMTPATALPADATDLATSQTLATAIKNVLIAAKIAS